jgi:hypothetical protein
MAGWQATPSVRHYFVDQSAGCPPVAHDPVAGLAELQAGKGLAGLATDSTTQTRSFSSASAPGLDEAGFWPVTSLPSVTTKGTQFATFS